MYFESELDNEVSKNKLVPSALVTFKPNEIYLDFFKNFIEYDIYIIIDVL